MGINDKRVDKGSNSKTDDIVEVLDITGTAHSTMSAFQEFCKDISKAPVAKQAAVGGFSGWVVGYLSMKVGKMAATAVGGSLIIMQLAAHQGYIKVDWRRVNKDLESKAKKLTREVESRINPGMTDQSFLDRTAQNIAGKIDRKLDSMERRSESFFDSKMRSANRFYRKYILGDKEKLTVEDLYVINMYIIAFSAGTMLGVATAKLI